VAHKVILTETALNDLASISDYLAEVAGEDVAATQDTRLKTACFSLTHFPHRGRPRDEIYPRLRSISSRLATIFYFADEDEVRIIHVIHPRRDAAAVFQDI
jgi:toxin ParE1/3/4